jgi:hypothetical protein
MIARNLLISLIIVLVVELVLYYGAAGLIMAT